MKLLCSRVREAVSDPDLRWVIEYELCSERTLSGEEFLYIKGYERCYHGCMLLDEQLGVSPVLDTGVAEALDIYTMICQADQPVSPTHLVDVVQDLLLSPETRTPNLGKGELFSRRSSVDLPRAAALAGEN